MGHIGDKVPALALRLLQGVGHGIEGGRQLTDLAAVTGLLHPYIEIAAGIGTGRLDHLGQGLYLPHGGDKAGHERQQQDNGAGHKEQGDEGTPHLGQLRAVHHRQHQSQRVAVRVCHGHAHHELLFLIYAHGAAALVQSLAAQHRLGNVLGDNDGLSGQIGIRRQQDAAGGVADQEVHVRHPGGHPRQRAQSVLLIPLGILAGGEVVHGQLRHQQGAVAHLLPLFRQGVVIAQGVKGHTQQRQRQQHHAGGQHELPPVEAAGHAAYPFPCAAHLTSNL